MRRVSLLSFELFIGVLSGDLHNRFLLELWNIDDGFNEVYVSLRLRCSARSLYRLLFIISLSLSSIILLSRFCLDSSIKLQFTKGQINDVFVSQVN